MPPVKALAKVKISIHHYDIYTLAIDIYILRDKSIVHHRAVWWPLGRVRSYPVLGVDH